MMQVKHIDYQVPRLAFFWLLLAQTFLLLPHFFDYFFVLFPAWLFCVIWRIGIYQAKASYPNAIFKFFMVVMALVAIRWYQPRWLMLETAILMLLLAFLFKLIEMREKRDVLVLIYLAYFVLAAQLLISQTLWEGLYLLIGLLLVTTALVALNSNKKDTQVLVPFTLSAKLVALSMPLMLLGFLVFPRLDPLWKVPMPHAAKTGVSGVMSPGMFSSLARSDAVAFRVKFTKTLPPLNKMYWRGMTLPLFDGIKWLPSHHPVAAFINQPADSLLERYDYQITMEPTQQVWLFLLGNIVSINPSVLQKNDATLQTADIIDQRQLWQVSSLINAQSTLIISDEIKNESLQLPKGFNPQTLAFAKNLRKASVSDNDYIKQVLAYFHQQPFFYSLNPPLLKKNTIDDFLFSTKKGFCEHYAASFVVLMRAVNIPARVVVGYQGGDINPYEHHITVRQLDAHAWTEVWLKGQGWVKVDPTYAVMPDRIEKGSQQSLQQDDNFLAKNPLSPLRLRSLSWLTKIQYRFDQLNFLWQTSVLQYNNDLQTSLLQRILGQVSLVRIAALVLAVFIVVAMVIAVISLWRYRPLPLSQAEKIYRYWLKLLAKRGMVKMQGEGAFDFSIRVKYQFPQAAVEIDAITDCYYQLQYAPNIDEHERLQLYKKMKQLITQYVSICA